MTGFLTMRVLIYFIGLSILSGCGAGPSKRYVENGWRVSENICTSDPKQPELNDMRSEIRQAESYQTSYSRKITIFHLDKTILNVSQNFNKGGNSGEFTLHKNSTENPVIETISIRGNRELNNYLVGGIEKFFADDPDIDGKDANSFCLYRGQ